MSRSNLDVLHRAVDELIRLKVIDEPDAWPHFNEFPAPGEARAWYWTPKGGRPEVLGHNTYSAFAQLVALRDAA